MNMKRIAASLCAAATVFTMSACSSGSSADTTQTSSETSAESVSESASENGSEMTVQGEIIGIESVPKETESTEIQENPAKGKIAYTLPDGFESKGENTTEMVFGDGIANINIKSTYNEDGYPPVDEFEATGRLMNEFLYQSFTLEYEDPVKGTLQGYDSISSTYTVRDPDDKTNAAKYRSVYVETETCAYILTIGSLEQDFDGYADTFEQFLSSVSFS